MTSAHGQAKLSLQIHDNEWQNATGNGPCSRTSSAARSVACRVLPFVIMNLETQLSLSVSTCHLNRSGFAAAQIFLHCRLNGMLCSGSEYAGLGLGFSCGAGPRSPPSPAFCVSRLGS